MPLLKVKRDFRRAKKVQMNMGLLLSRIGKVSIAMFRKNFKDEEIGGNKWKQVQRKIKGTQAFTRATRAQRKRKILHGDSGDLRTSMKIESIVGNTITIVADTDYSVYHQDGTERIPQRQFMGQTDELDKMVIDVIDDHMEKRIHSLI